MPKKLDFQKKCGKIRSVFRKKVIWKPSHKKDWQHFIVSVIDFRPISSCKLPDEWHVERLQAKYKVVYYNILTILSG